MTPELPRDPNNAPRAMAAATAGTIVGRKKAVR